MLLNIVFSLLIFFIGEIQYDTVDTTKCFTDEHPGPEYRLRYLHTIASTQKYIVIPETSYTEDVCFSRIDGSNWGSDGGSDGTRMGFRWGADWMRMICWGHDGALMGF